MNRRSLLKSLAAVLGGGAVMPRMAGADGPTYEFPPTSGREVPVPLVYGEWSGNPADILAELARSAGWELDEDGIQAWREWADGPVTLSID